MLATCDWASALWLRQHSESTGFLGHPVYFTVNSSMFKWSTEYMIESYCPVMMSDQRKGKCSWAQCVNTSVVINLELTCHTWDLSGKLSEIIDTTASADPFFPISKLVNVSCSEMSLEPSHCPMSYSLRGKSIVLGWYSYPWWYWHPKGILSQELFCCNTYQCSAIFRLKKSKQSVSIQYQEWSISGNGKWKSESLQWIV